MMSNERIATTREQRDFWFAMVDIDVLQDTELSMMAKFIYAVVCTFASVMGGSFWPSIERVSQTANVDIETVRKAYMELERKGLLSAARARWLRTEHSDDDSEED